MSAISSIGNLIKSLPQRLTGKPQGDAGQKAAPAATAPQNGGDGTGLSTEVNSLLAANPPPWQWILSAFVIIAAGTVGSYFLWKGLKPADFKPSSDYATYAGLFIMALAIERILEPFSGLFAPGTKRKKAASRATAAQAKHAQTAATVTGQHAAAVVPVGPARKAVVAHQEAVVQRAAAARTAATAAQKEAALAQTKFHRAQGARAVLMWATASVLAMLVCASAGVFLLRSVEAPASPGKTSAASSASGPANGPNRVLDLLVTGLVVGAGTKPLHDLITQVQTSSSSSKAKASSPTTTS